MSVAKIDNTKFYLGDLCPKGHDWEATGHSLRYLPRGKKRVGSCVVCCRTRTRRVKIQCSELEEDLLAKAGIDSTKRYLGSPCLKQHLFLNTQKTLRLRSNGTCLTCAAERYEAYYRQFPEKKYQADKRYREANLEKVKQRKKQKYWLDVEVSRKEQNSRYPKRKQRHLEYFKHYSKTEKGKLVLRNIRNRRRARKASVHHFEYSKEQIEARITEFKGLCAYCCTNKATDMDHFIPLALSGPDCLGNLVPACETCNSSKNALDPYEWYSRQPFFKKQQWNFILRILGKTVETYNQIPLF